MTAEGGGRKQEANTVQYTKKGAASFLLVYEEVQTLK
jgi:hypothetical protein